MGAACCACNDDDDPVVIASELEITPPQLDFEWNQTDSQLVTVNTNGSSWTAEPAADWITVTPGDGSFTVSVAENPATEDRQSTVTVKADELKATLTVKQGFNREGSWYVEFVSENDAVFYNVSDNGKWAVGSYNGNTLIYNIETGEAVYNTVDGEEGQANNQDAYDISDDGTPVGSYLTLPAVYRDGAWQEYDTDGHSMGAIYGISPDGTVSPASWERAAISNRSSGSTGGSNTSPVLQRALRERKPMPDSLSSPCPPTASAWAPTGPTSSAVTGTLRAKSSITAKAPLFTRKTG